MVESPPSSSPNCQHGAGSTIRFVVYAKSLSQQPLFLFEYEWGAELCRCFQVRVRKSREDGENMGWFPKMYTFMEKLENRLSKCYPTDPQWICISYYPNAVPLCNPLHNGNCTPHFHSSSEELVWRLAWEGVDVFEFNPQRFLILGLKFLLRREKADLSDITIEREKRGRTLWRAHIQLSHSDYAGTFQNVFK